MPERSRADERGIEFIEAEPEDTVDAVVVRATGGRGLGLLAVAVLGITLLLLSGARRGADPEQARSSISAPSTLPETTAAQDAHGPRWPDPPEDHDPHVLGGPIPAMTEAAEQRSIIYVNDRGRPTIVDLTGGQRFELNVAPGRDRDHFYVENGAVVAGPDRPNRSLPISTGNQFRIDIARNELSGRDDNETQRMGASPTLCLLPGSCADQWLTGRYGGSARSLMSVDDDRDATVVMAELLGSEEWVESGRWVTFDRPGSSATNEVRLPRPSEEAIVWLLTEPLVEAEPTSS